MAEKPIRLTSVSERQHDAGPGFGEKHLADDLQRRRPHAGGLDQSLVHQ
jgi:hypothetical protein